MPAVAHLEWRDSSESRGDNGVTVTESYLILDATSRQDAFLAAGLPSGSATYNGDPLTRVRGRDMRQEGPTTYRCTVTYNRVTIDPNDDPLNRPWTIEWGRRQIEVPSEIDATGRPIVNTAYQYFDPPPTRVLIIQSLSITRFESFYDWSFLSTYLQTTNSNIFTIANQRFAAGDALCEDIGPASSYEADAEYIPIRYTFLLWRDSRTASGFPFDHHIPNLGADGFFDKGGTKTLGAFVGSDGNPTGPVPLDSTGKPRDATIRIMNGQKPETPVAATAPSGMPSGFAFQYSPFSSDAFPRLLFKKFPQSDFSGLLT